MDTFAIGAIDVEGTILRAPSDVSENPNTQVVRRYHAGRIAPIYQITGGNSPEITFNTPEVATALSVITINGKALAATTVYYTKRLAIQVSAGADHPKTTLAKGIVVPRTLSWNGGVNPWLLNLMLAPESTDGLAGPFAYGTGALPALAVIPETLCGGKLVVNGTEVDCLQNATLDFGMTIDRVVHKGLPAPVRSAVRRVAPSLRLQNLNPADRAVFGQFGTRITSCVLYLRKNETADGATPTRVPDATLQHVSLTFVDGIVHPAETTAPEDGDATQSIVLNFDENAAAAWCVPAYNVAIPA